MDVLLTHSNHLFFDRKQIQKMQPYPPLQTLLAAAALRDRGFEVSVCDVFLESPYEAIESALERTRPRMLVICEDDFNFITKMCLSHSRELAFWIAKIARRYGCVVVAHGSDASDHVAEYCAAGCDYIVLGEVEETLVELAEGRPQAEIAGLAYQIPGETRIRYNARRPLRTNLDILPSPAWDLIDIEQYRGAWNSCHGFFSLNMVSSRGCPYRCNWCAKPVYGSSYHVRSPRLVADEMLAVKTRYRPDHIWFADDIFALSARWTREFSKAVQDLGAQIPFKMQSRCDLMTRSTVADLERAGCREVWMGAESGSQRVLDAMEKGIRVEQIYEARENLRQRGIRVGWFLQFGYPGEGWQEIEATVRMVRETKPDDIGISVSYPLPGTKFHQIVSSQLGRKSNWSDSGDLAMMFRGAYSSEFYRALADALHLEVRDGKNERAIHHAWEKVRSFREPLAHLAGVAS
jgi:anaerobic magnesium-protoporphyrin IX monomethyl ester cyclase